MKDVHPKAQPFLEGKAIRPCFFARVHRFTSELLPTAEILHAISDCTVSAIPATRAWYYTGDLTLPAGGLVPGGRVGGKKLLSEYQHVFVAGLSMGVFCPYMLVFTCPVYEG